MCIYAELRRSDGSIAEQAPEWPEPQSRRAGGDQRMNVDTAFRHRRRRMEAAAEQNRAG